MAVTTSGKDKILRWARIYLGGYGISGAARTFSSARCEYGEADFTGWSDAVRNYLRDGHMTSGLEGFQAAMDDTATTGAFILMKTAPDTNLSLLFGGGGEPAVGDPAYLLPAVQLNDDASFDSNVGILSATFKPKAGTLAAAGSPLGVVLSPEISISSTTTNGSHDNGGATTGGWHAILHVTATNSGNYAFTIEHSANDSAYSTLGTFSADGSAVTSEYLSSTGTVNQYVRFVATRTAGDTTPVVTFARG